MRRVLLFALLVGCGDDPKPTGPITAHVTHYDYAFDLGTRAAHSKLTLTAETAGDCVTLPFRATELTTARFDGADADATLADNALTICGAGVETGKTFTVESDQSVALATLKTSQVGYSVSNDTEGNQLTYLVSWVNGCDQFGPCDSRPDQFATYTFDVTHDASLMVRCPGDVTDKSATETICDFQHPGGPTYSTFGFAAYPAWTQSDKGTWSGVHVTMYDRASTGIGAALDPAYHSGYLDFMQANFGPFPFGTELRVLTAPTYWDGFEHPGNIVLDDHVAKETGSYTHPAQHVLDHEMTHMWAGDQTTIASTYDFVWKESMAEYLSFVYEDMTDQAVAARTSEIWKLDSGVAKYWPVPMDQPALFDYYGDVYGPGPMVLFRQLEVLTSREQVLAALKSVLGTPRALSVDELVEALARETHLDLGDYVTAWIKGSGRPNWPTVATTWHPGAAAGDPATLDVAVTSHSATPRGCRFHVALGDGGTTNVVKVEVDTFHNGQTQAIAVTTPAFAVTKIDLDPDHECLVFPASATAREGTARGWRSSH